MQATSTYVASMFPDAPLDGCTLYRLQDYQFAGHTQFGGRAMTSLETQPRKAPPEWSTGTTMGTAAHAWDAATHSLQLQLRYAAFPKFWLDIQLTPEDVWRTANPRTAEHTLPSTRAVGYLGQEAGAPQVRLCLLDHTLVITDTRQLTHLTLPLPVATVRAMEAFRPR